MLIFVAIVHAQCLAAEMLRNDIDQHQESDVGKLLF